MLDLSGVGEAIEYVVPREIDDLSQDRQRSNELLLKSLRQDKFADELMDLTLRDAKLGRMSQPVLVDSCDLHKVLLAPRFAVEQGFKKDGSIKIRAVDNFSWSCPPVDNTAWRSKRVVKGECYVFALSCCMVGRK